MVGARGCFLVNVARRWAIPWQLAHTFIASSNFLSGVIQNSSKGACGVLCSIFERADPTFGVLLMFYFCQFPSFSKAIIVMSSVNTPAPRIYFPHQCPAGIEPLQKQVWKLYPASQVLALEVLIDLDGDHDPEKTAMFRSRIKGAAPWTPADKKFNLAAMKRLRRMWEKKSTSGSDEIRSHTTSEGTPSQATTFSQPKDKIMATAPNSKSKSAAAAGAANSAASSTVTGRRPRGSSPSPSAPKAKRPRPMAVTLNPPVDSSSAADSPDSDDSESEQDEKHEQLQKEEDEEEASERSSGREVIEKWLDQIIIVKQHTALLDTLLEEAMDLLKLESKDEAMKLKQCLRNDDKVDERRIFLRGHEATLKYMKTDAMNASKLKLKPDDLKRHDEVIIAAERSHDKVDEMKDMLLTFEARNAEEAESPLWSQAVQRNLEEEVLERLRKRVIETDPRALEQQLARRIAADKLIKEANALLGRPKDEQGLAEKAIYLKQKLDAASCFQSSRKHCEGLYRLELIYDVKHEAGSGLDKFLYNPEETHLYQMSAARYCEGPFRPNESFKLILQVSDRKTIDIPTTLDADGYLKAVKDATIKLYCLIDDLERISRRTSSDQVKCNCNEGFELDSDQSDSDLESDGSSEHCSA